MSLTLPPVDKTKVPIKNVQGLQDSLAAKVNIATLESATDQFYTKTQSNARFINQDREDTITTVLNVPTPAVGTNTTQIANTAFVSQNAMVKVYSNTTQINNTGSTTENTILTFTLPGNLIGPNGSFHIVGLVSFNNNTNSKAIRVKFNGTTVLLLNSNVAAGSASKGYNIVYNRNSLSSQIFSSPVSQQSGGFGINTTAAPATATIDTSSTITVTITAQCSTSSTDNITLEALEIFKSF